MAKLYPCQTYRCGDCGALGVKLWREYNTVLEHQTLRCFVCAVKQQKKTVRVVDGNGRTDCYAKTLGADRLGDQIGWLIPAVPTVTPDDGASIGKDGTYWGYTSVPTDALSWWYTLPIIAASPSVEGR